MSRARVKRACGNCGTKLLRGVRVMLTFADGTPPRGATVCLRCARRSVPILAAYSAELPRCACGAVPTCCAVCAAAAASKARPRVVVRRGATP